MGKIKKATRKFLSSNRPRKEKPKAFKRKKTQKDEDTLVESSSSSGEEDLDLGFALPQDQQDSDDEMDVMESDHELSENSNEEPDSEGEYEIDNNDDEFRQFDRKPAELLAIIKRAKSGSFTALRLIWKELKRVSDLETKENEELIIYASYAYLSTAKICVKQYKSSCKQFMNVTLTLLKRRCETVLKYFEHIVPILLEFKKTRKDFLKVLVSLWCHDSDKIRIKAFLAIRKMAMADTLILEESLKIMYNAMVQFKVNAYNYVIAQFMVNCMVEMAGLSIVVTYNHMFVSLRKLAILLRQVVGGKDATSIYNWQVMFAMRLWARVVTTFPEEEFLKPLLYPLVQLMVGIIRHKLGVRYLPFKLSIIKLLLQIAGSCKTFIPVSSYLLDVFNMNELKQDGKPSTLKPLDLVF